MSLSQSHLVVEEMRDPDEWEHFLSSTPGASFYHSIKWKAVLEEGLGLETRYLVVRDGSGRLVGVCPFAVSRGASIFRVLVSLPHSDCGGPIFSPGAEKESALALSAYLQQQRHELRVSYVRMRCHSSQIAHYLSTGRTAVERSMGTMDLDLQGQPTQILWDQVFTRASRQRTRIRRLENDGFHGVLATGLSDVQEFYRLYDENMAHVGAQPRPPDFFRVAWDLLYPDYFNIMLVTNGSRCIGAEAFYVYPPLKTIYHCGVGLDRSGGNKYHLYLYICWSTAKWAESAGFHHVCLGNTPADVNSVYYREKSQIGASFHQDYLLYTPLDLKAFLVREGLLRFGKKLHHRLPQSLRRPFSSLGGGL